MVFALLIVGYQTRVVSILSCVITIAHCHRLTGAYYGLDQINAVIATYLAVGNCGGVYSVDHWLAKRRGLGLIVPSVDTNIATRLWQLHMCVIYLFGGIGKARGELWWDGSTCWFAIACKEYQSFDLTFLVRYPWFLATLTHITLFWEVFYCFLVRREADTTALHWARGGGALGDRTVSGHADVWADDDRGEHGVCLSRNRRCDHEFEMVA